MFSGYPVTHKEAEGNGGYCYKKYIRLSYSQDMIFDPATWEKNLMKQLKQ